MTIYFATNRDKTNNGFGIFFNAEGPQTLRFGKAEKNADGQISYTTANESLFRKVGSQLIPVKKPKLGSQEILNELRETMKNDERDTVLFIHGFNVSFDDAIEAAFKLKQNLKDFEGKGVNVACFSWPSNGQFYSYHDDRSDAESSKKALSRLLLIFTQFYRSIATDDQCNKKIHLMCHSMGNYVLRNALGEYLAQQRISVKIFDQIFLMAADEDDDTFEHDEKLKHLTKIGDRINVYFNRGDRALTVSDFTKGNPDRLGTDGARMPSKLPSRVDQIDCTPVVKGVVEHSYYIESDPVNKDIKRCLSGEEPEDVSYLHHVPSKNKFLLKP